MCLISSASARAYTFSKAEWILKLPKLGFEGGVKILVTIEFNLSVSLIIILRNFEEKSSSNFLFKI